MQAALLRAVVDRAFGDLELDPGKVTLVAAANPPSEAAGGWELAPPLANRFTHHHYQLVPEQWVDAFPGYWANPPELVFGDRSVKESAWSKARSLVAAFIRSRPTLLLQMPQDESKRGQAWPSPRTWDYLSRLLASATESGGSAMDVLPLLAGCVGEGPALELCHWLKELDLPDPEELLRKPGAYRHPERGDQAYAVLSAVCQAAIHRCDIRSLACRLEDPVGGGLRRRRRCGRRGGQEPGPGAARRSAPAGQGDIGLLPRAAGSRSHRSLGGETMDAETKLSAAALKLTMERPYLGAALWAVQRIACPEVDTMGVDRHWRLYYSPAAVAAWSVEETAGVLYHEICHLIREHAGRGGFAEDKYLWNLAADAEINDGLREEGVTLPGEPIFPATLGQPEGKLAEEYYAALPKRKTLLVIPRTGPGCGCCGSGATGAADGKEAFVAGAASGLSEGEARWCAARSPWPSRSTPAAAARCRATGSAGPRIGWSPGWTGAGSCPLWCAGHWARPPAPRTTATAVPRGVSRASAMWSFLRCASRCRASPW